MFLDVKLRSPEFTPNKCVKQTSTAKISPFSSPDPITAPELIRTDFCAGDSAVQLCPDCREEFHICLVLSVPMQKHWAG